MPSYIFGMYAAAHSADSRGCYFDGLWSYLVAPIEHQYFVSNEIALKFISYSGNVI